MSHLHAAPMAFMSLVLIATPTHVGAKEGCDVRSGRQVMPLVELYTSEGCSSCPAADRWLSRQLMHDDANFLAFHVDYWDDIGWPDRFASPGYSKRQRERANAASQRTVFTPQVMLGRIVQATWYDDRAWQQALSDARVAAGADLTIRLERVSNGWLANVTATSIAASSRGTQLWVARTGDGHSSVVRAGENRGKTLHHDRVVDQLSGPWTLPATGTLSRQIDMVGMAHTWAVTAFAQDADGNILQSLSLTSDVCGT